MTVMFHCDAPGCASRNAFPGALPGGNPFFANEPLPFSCPDATSAPARVTALEVSGLRDRENPAERPVVYLAPIGWTPIAMRDGRRLYACSRTCAEEIVGREGRDPTGRRIGATCPACGQSVDGAWGDESLDEAARPARLSDP